MAIKILRPGRPGAVSQERLRFEARALSRLSHPFISALHDVGQWQGLDYIVTELLEGEALDGRRAKRPLSTQAALLVGVQVARALEAAHRVGIVHRDVKPSNIMLTDAGAKLIDFGIASDTTEPGTSAASGTTAEEVRSPRTIAYSSPEQLEALPVDGRSDLFSLGIVLYEMLTRRHPFKADSTAGYIAAILEHDPAPLAGLAPGTTPATQRAVMKALEKDSAARWQNAGDLASELEWVTYFEQRERMRAPRRRLRMAAVIAAVLALGTVLGAIAWQQRQARPPVPVFAFQVDPGEGSVITTSAYAFSISPDGSAIAYTQSSGGPRLLAIRQLASTAAVDLVGTDDAWAPFWSPDSGSIAFFAAGKLKRFDVATRSVQTIADVPRQALGIGSWGSAATYGAPLVSLCMSSVPPACRLQRRCHARQSKARPRRVPVIRVKSGAHDHRISTRDQLG